MRLHRSMLRAAQVGGGAGGDPLYSLVKLLSHVNTTPTIVDRKGHTISGIGSPTIASGIAGTFYPNVVQLNGAGLHGLEAFHASDFDVRTGNFCVETRFRPSSDNTNLYLWMSFGATSLANPDNIRAQFIQQGVGNPARVYLYAASVGEVFSATLGFFTNEWVTLAIVREGDTLHGVLNGVSVISQAVSGSLVPTGVPQYASVFESSKTDPVYVEEWRITAGNSRYTLPYTPAAEPFPIA